MTQGIKSLFGIGRFQKGIIVISFFMLVGVQLYACYMGLFAGVEDVYWENGLLENVQVVTLFAALLMFARYLKDLPRYNFIINLVMTLLCFTFLLRELQVEDFDIPTIFIVLFSGLGKWIFLTALWVVLGLYALRYFSVYWKNFQIFARTGFSILIISGGVFLLLGDVFEKHIFPTVHFRFYEESLELVGFYLLFVAGLISGQQMRLED
ncbi:MAG: hypothetical protein DHS20C02_08640 [Micavibrio sp.]|nr:MAG: hypothetical protein DHS20C02_08640 [Micavibrio sp.]